MHVTLWWSFLVCEFREANITGIRLRCAVLYTSRRITWVRPLLATLVDSRHGHERPIDEVHSREIPLRATRTNYKITRSASAREVNAHESPLRVSLRQISLPFIGAARTKCAHEKTNYGKTPLRLGRFSRNAIVALFLNGRRTLCRQNTGIETSEFGSTRWRQRTANHARSRAMRSNRISATKCRDRLPRPPRQDWEACDVRMLGTLLLQTEPVTESSPLSRSCDVHRCASYLLSFSLPIWLAVSLARQPIASLSVSPIVPYASLRIVISTSFNVDCLHHRRLPNVLSHHVALNT